MPGDAQAGAKAAPKAQAKAPAAPKAKKGAKATEQPKVKAVPVPRAEPKAKAKANTVPKSQADTKTQEQRKGKAVPEAKAESEAKAKANAAPKSKADTKAKEQPEVKALPKTRAESEATEKTKAAPKAKAKARAKAQPKVKAVTKVRAQPKAALRSTSDIISFGTTEEPVFLLPDRALFGDHGAFIQKSFLQNCRKTNTPVPMPTGDQVWKSWVKGRRVRVRALEPFADLILSQILRVQFKDVRHVMTPDRGYDCKDVNVYSKGGNKGRHQDAQPYGSLVFVFCAGLSCKSSVWLKNGERRDVEMQSGDCMIFEGKTWHKVQQCIPGTSPFKQGEWLADRRISVLVRQKPPRSGTRA